jgi:hypothetical protein
MEAYMKQKNTDLLGTNFYQTETGKEQMRQQASERGMGIAEYIRFLIGQDRLELGLDGDYEQPLPPGIHASQMVD